MVVTKIHPRSYSPEKLVESVQRSRRRIYKRLDDNRPLDVVLLHAPSCWRGHCTREEESHSWQEAWQALESLKGPGPGQIHAIGVSNFDRKQLKELLDITNKRVSVLQNWMDPFHHDADVRRMCIENGIVYMAYSTLGTQWEQKLGRNPVFTSPDLQRIAEKHNRSIPDVVLSWALQEKVVAIPRASSAAHIESNAALIGTDGYPQVFLDAADMRDIQMLDGSLGNPWD